MVQLLKGAVCVLGGMFSQNADTLPNVPFAREVAASEAIIVSIHLSSRL